MKKAIVTAVFGVILSTSAVKAENQTFRFEFLNEGGTEALGVGHGDFDPTATETITIQNPPGSISTNLRLERIGITVNSTNGSAYYVHTGRDVNDVAINDLYHNTWLNTDDQEGAGYSDGTVRTDGSWRFGTTEDRNLTLNFNDRTWTQDTMESQVEGGDPVQVKSNGIFRLRMVESDEELEGLLEEVIDEDTTNTDSGTGDNDTVPDAPEFGDETENIFDNTEVNNIVEEAKAAEEAKNNKSGSGALGFLAFLALPMAIRRRRDNA